MSKRKKNTILALIEFLFFIFFEKLFFFLPAKIAYKIAEFVASFAFLIDIKHRNRTIQHLLHAGVAANFAEAKKMAKANFIHFADMIVDTVKFNKILKTEDEIRGTVEVTGDSEGIKNFFSAGAKNSIIITAHYGNWEVSGILYSCITNNKVLSIVRDFDNPLLRKSIFEKRCHFGVSLVEKENSVKPLLKALKNNESICIIADQHASTSEGLNVIFFGQPARAHKSPALIQNKTKVPIIVAVCERLSPLTHKIRVCKPIYFDPKRSEIETVQLYTKQLEELIRENPLQWCWTHRRWLNINRKK